MRKAPEARDHRMMPARPFGHIANLRVTVERSEQFDCALLCGEIFGVLKRQINEAALERR